MQERRKYVRFNASCCVQFHQRGVSSPLQGVVKDLSMAGLRLSLNPGFNALPGQLIDFYLLLPGKTIEISGHIAWINCYRDSKEIGIQFSCIADRYKQDIYEHISNYYRKELLTRWWQM